MLDFSILGCSEQIFSRKQLLRAPDKSPASRSEASFRWYFSRPSNTREKRPLLAGDLTRRGEEGFYSDKIKINLLCFIFSIIMVLVFVIRVATLFRL